MNVWHGFLDRRRDRPARRPPGLLFGMDDTPPFGLTVALAVQHVAVQSVYFVLPAAMASMLSPDPADATRFLSLSILAIALWQGVQGITRGPVGSGYPIAATHTAALIGAFGLIGQGGGGFHEAAAMVVLCGVAATLLTFVMHRLRVLLPNEVAGVVVILIGVALAALATQRLGLQPGGTLPGAGDLAAMAVGLLLMAGVTLSQGRLAPFAVLIGSAVAIPVALEFGQGAPHAAAVLAAAPWFALPAPFLPAFGHVAPAALGAFLVSLVAIKATALGAMVSVQRAVDVSWTRADAPPLRRGLLANGLAILAAGVLGAAVPGPAMASVGLSIATGTLARRIVRVGIVLLVAVALCPKLVALFVLVPEPVKAAMLFYVAGFLMAQGCALVTARLLDTRRTIIVALGLSAGVAEAVAPGAFALYLPAFASPISLGALVAFMANLATLPLVTRRASLDLKLDAGAPRAMADWVGGLGGAWGLKAHTAEVAEHALLELAELLAARGIAAVMCGGTRLEDRVVLSIAWQGAALPPPNARPHYEDLFGAQDQQEGFAVWLITRNAAGFTQSEAGGRAEARLTFDD